MRSYVQFLCLGGERMYIDTHTKETIAASVCEYLGFTKDELKLFFDSAYYSQKPVEEEISDFVDKTMPEIRLDEIQFYHLSRRLLDDNSRVGNNLYDLLTQDTSVSRFLREHDVEFKMNEGHLLLFHRGKIETFERVYEGNVSNVKWRMGYFKGHEDYCVNGFALKDMLHENSYTISLRSCPEFIEQMSLVIGRKDIIRDYERNSRYYCLEYLVPMDKVIFDGFSYKTQYSKTKHLLCVVLKRLYDYEFNSRYMYDHDNLILRLEDDDTMQEEYFIAEEEIK